MRREADPGKPARRLPSPFQIAQETESPVVDPVQSPFDGPYVPVPGRIRPDIRPVALIIAPTVHQPGLQQPGIRHRPGQQAGGFGLLPPCVGRRFGKKCRVDGQGSLESAAVRAIGNAGRRTVFPVFLARIGTGNRPQLETASPVLTQREQGPGQPGERLPAPGRFTEYVHPADAGLPVQGDPGGRNRDTGLSAPSQPAGMRTHRPVQCAEQGPLDMAARIVPGHAAIRPCTVEGPGRRNAVRPLGESVQGRQACQLEGTPEGQSLPVADIVVPDEYLSFRQPVKAVECPVPAFPGPGRFQVPRREAVFRAHILQCDPNQGRMTERKRVPDRLAGTAGGFQGKERAERRDRLFSESIHPLQLGEGQHIPGKAAVLGKRRGLIRGQEPAFQQAGPGCPVEGQGTDSERFQFVDQPVVQGFGAVRPGEIQGRPDDFVGLGGGRRSGQQEHEQHDSSSHGPKIRFSSGLRCGPRVVSVQNKCFR